MTRIIALAATLTAVTALAVGASSAAAAERPSLADQIASRLGVTPEQLRAAFTGALTARIDAAVAAGKLTPAQGARLKERIADAKGLGLRFGPKLGAELRERHARAVGRFAGRHKGAAATYLGLTRAQLLAELRKGQSLAQIATARGKSVAGLVSAIVAPAKDRIAKAVAAKRLTQQQADRALERLTDAVERLVQRSFAPRR